MKNVLQRHNVTVKGNGSRPMLFAHGYGCDQNVWRHVTPAFENEYKVILFDHVGAGKSDLSVYDREKYSSLNGYAADIIEIIEALQLTDVVFVGHSVSAMIGQLAANERPELFSRLIHIGPSPRYIDEEGYRGGFSEKDLNSLLDLMESNYSAWASYVAPLIMGNPDRPALGQELTENFCSNDPAIAKHFARVTFLSDHRADLSKSKVPGIILQCAMDIITPEEVGRYMHKHTPLTTFHLMKATGHCPHMSHPVETINVMKKYLEVAQEQPVS